MKKFILVVLAISFVALGNAQQKVQDSLADFDCIHFNEHLSEMKDNSARENYLKTVHRNYIKRKYDLHEQKIFRSSAIATSTCGNLDFEDGNMAGWTTTGDFQIMSGTATDPFGGFPVVFPGGNFSLRLNDNNTSCSGPTQKTGFKSSAAHNIIITPSNTMIIVNFAAATLAFPHPQNASAFFKIEFLDQFNVPIPTPTFSAMYASPPNAIVSTSSSTYFNSSLQGAQICSTIGNYPVIYFPWQAQAFNMSSYIGQTISIKLTANWCLYDYDWTYAYFDVCCDGSCPYTASNVVNNMCVNSTLNTNFCSSTGTNINYNWYNSSGPMATGSCVTVNSAGSYTLQSTSPTNTTAIVQEIFNLGLNPTVSFSVSSNVACNNSSSGVTLFVSPPGGVFSGPGISGNTFQPWVVGIGTYTLSYVYSDPYAGCKDSATQTIQVTHCKITNAQQHFKSSELVIAPNPFINEVLINSKDLPENCDFVLFNTIGKEIIRKRLVNSKNTIETEGIPQGLYIYSIEQQNKAIKQGKLVKD